MHSLRAKHTACWLKWRMTTSQERCSEWHKWQSGLQLNQVPGLHWQSRSQFLKLSIKSLAKNTQFGFWLRSEAQVSASEGGGCPDCSYIPQLCVFNLEQQSAGISLLMSESVTLALLKHLLLQTPKPGLLFFSVPTFQPCELNQKGQSYSSCRATDFHI